MLNEEITLEICTNNEAIREWCGLSFASRVEGGLENEAAESVSEELFDRLGAAGYQTQRASGQRTQCHGWNGCNLFAHKLGPVGTFDSLTADQVAEIEAITEAADACAAATFGQYEVDCRSHNSRSESFANLAEAEVSYEQFLDELQNCVTEGRDAWSLCLTDNGKVLRYDSFGC